MTKDCKHCTWYRIGTKWTSICSNKNSENCRCECIEAVYRDPKKCADKEIDDAEQQ